MLSLELDGDAREASTKVGLRQRGTFQRFGQRCEGGSSICSRVAWRAALLWVPAREESLRRVKDDPGLAEGTGAQS